MDSRFFSTAIREEDLKFDNTLRPVTLDEYIGQTQVKENLRVFIKAANLRKEPLDHILLCSAPGLGKTTLAHIIAKEMGTNIKATSGPAIERPIDLLVLLKNLQQNDVLFIDEIHRLNKTIEEMLYPAMEDFNFDRIISRGGVNKSAKIKLPYFTLVGATTRSGKLSSPLRNRFGITFNLDFYHEKFIEEIINRSAGILNISTEIDSVKKIAKCSRGTPRIANRLLKRVRDFAQVETNGVINFSITLKALKNLGIDEFGLDEVDRRILKFIIDKFKGGPVGLESLAGAVNEEPENIEEVYEPYLVQLGFINKTPRGRMAGPNAYEHLGLEINANLQTSFLKKE